MTSTQTRPPTTGAIQQAASRGTSANPTLGCKDCVKQGLAILPVIPTPIPLSLRGASNELKQLDNRFIAEDLKAHWLALRTLPSGYLYVMKPDLTWDAYLVDAEGLLRMMAATDAPASPAQQASMSESCKRSGDNVPAQVIAIDPEKHATVWLAFSRYRWTVQVMKDYADNAGGCRDKRMRKLDVMAAAQGSLGAGNTAANAVKFGVPMSADVGTVVADYASPATGELLNKHVVTPIRSRSQFAATLATKMAQISAKTHAKTGAIIALGDDLGTAIEVNAMRNAEVAAMGTYMQKHQRERLVGDIILGFEKSFVENQQAAEWTKRYAKHYNGKKLLADKSSYEARIKQWNTSISAKSADVSASLADQKLKPTWHDFDPKDDQSARDRQDATAACLNGTVKTAAEQALWDRWFAEDVADAYATLWGAVTALNPKFAEFMLGKQLPDAGKTDKLNDVFRNTLDAVKNFKEELLKRRNDQALALLGTAMASQVARVQILNPALYKVAGLRVIVIASVRTDVLVSPVVVQMTKTQQAMMMAEATFGPPEPRLTRLLDVEAKSSKRVYVVSSNGVDAYAFQGTVTTTVKARAVEMWLPDEVAKQLRLGAPVTQLLLAGPKINAFSGLVKFTKSAPGVFAWVGLTLQAMNLGNSFKDYKDDKVGDKTDANFGMASGALGVTGMMAEITAGAMKQMTAKFAVNAWAKVAFAGGVLAGLSATADAVQAFTKAADRYTANDIDATILYTGAGFFLAASGLAGFGGALAAGSAAGAFTGALGFLASAGTAAAVVPLWGWIAAGVIFLVIGFALVWQAIKDTDNPMEEWLKGSLYGVGPKRFTVTEEMTALNGVVYAMTVEVDWSGDAWEWFNTAFYDDYDNFKFSINLPNASADSVIDCKVTLYGKAKPREVFHETIRPRVLFGKVIDPHVPMIGPASPRSAAMPSYVWWEPPAIRNTADRGLRYGGQLKIDDGMYQEARVEISYWPDQTNMPDFVLPGAGERMLVGKK
jgi:hypothetical protein